MIYTAVIKENNKYTLELTEGHDWWVARKKLNVDKENIVALIPGCHRAGITFTEDGLALRSLDAINPRPLEDPDG